MKSKILALVGAPGVGKSEVAFQLSKRWQCMRTSTDDTLAETAEMGVKECYRRFGNARFRSLEEQVVYDILEGERFSRVSNAPFILDTGGGTLLSSRSRKLITENAIVVWLMAPIYSIIKRGLPPYLWGSATAEVAVREILEEREPFYRQAHLHMKCEDIESAGEVAMRVATLVKFDGKVFKCEGV